MTEPFTLNSVETMSGRVINLLDPKLEDFRINDIAWAISRQSRFAGHSISPVPYSVAQHTVQVSRYAEEVFKEGTVLHAEYLENLEEQIKVRDSKDKELELLFAHQDHVKFYKDNWKQFALHALMHDFAEAYMVDIPTPVKRLPGLYEAYSKVEKQLDLLIFKQLGLGFADKWPGTMQFSTDVVKFCDMYALKVEAYHLMPSRGKDWNLGKPAAWESIRAFREPISSSEAYLELLARYEELKPVVYID